MKGVLKSLQLDQFEFEVRQYHQDFLILKNDACGAAYNSKLGKCILDKDLPFVREVIASEKEILIALTHSEPVDFNRLSGIRVDEHQENRVWTIPFIINTEADWSHIETISGLSREAYMQAFLQCQLSMQMNGFLPGFPYLKGLKKELHCPRKTTPALRVQAGSIAVGGPYVGIYPVDSPGGWNVIGSTPLRIIGTDQIPPGYLIPGDEIKFKLIDESEYTEFKNQAINLHAYNIS